MLKGNLYDTLKFWVIRLLVLYDAVLRRLQPRGPAFLHVDVGAVAPGSRRMLCVFAHYDRDGLVDDYVLHYLARLNELGCEIIFVSNAPGLGEAGIARVREYCSRVIARENVGYDFGSWRDGLASCGDLSLYDRIIIANDSVYGPIHDIGPVFRAMESQGAKAWGITDSLRYGRHLQSYFLVFDRTVAMSAAFQTFWRDLPDYRLKHVVINRCEVGLSHRLRRAGFALAAYCDYREMEADLVAAAGNGTDSNLPRLPVNVTHLAWDMLIRDYGCPFVKVQLLRDNPKGVRDAKDWEAAIRDTSRYDVRLIRRHLQRAGG